MVDALFECKNQTIIIFCLIQGLEISNTLRKKHISYNNSHIITNRATPMMYCYYKLAFQLYKTFNDSLPDFKCIHWNLNQIKMSRQINLNIMRTNNLNVGLNALANRLYHLNGKIPLAWLNNSYIKFKIDYKNLLLSFNNQ
jgi:hypothetical protein